MKPSFTKDAEFGILILEGDFERLSLADMKKHLDMVVSQDCRYMIVDLTGVKKLSTSGLGLIFAGKSRLDDLGILVALVGEEKELNRLLPPGEIQKIIPLCESIERAKIALRRLDFERKAQVRRRRRYKR
jgi:anti-anti-sigma factor